MQMRITTHLALEQLQYNAVLKHDYFQKMSYANIKMIWLNDKNHR